MLSSFLILIPCSSASTSQLDAHEGLQKTRGSSVLIVLKEENEYSFFVIPDRHLTTQDKLMLAHCNGKSLEDCREPPWSAREEAVPVPQEQRMAASAKKVQLGPGALVVQRVGAILHPPKDGCIAQLAKVELRHHRTVRFAGRSRVCAFY